MATTFGPRLVLLIFGYVRNNFRTKQVVPTPIIHLLKDFYNGTIEWKSVEVTLECLRYKAEGPLIQLFGIPLQIAIEQTTNPGAQNLI